MTESTIVRKHRNRSQREQRRRTAAITLELILALPLMFIGLFGVVEFAAYFSGAQQVALASRVGAEEASQIALPIAGPVPPAMVDAVLAQLGSANISFCKIILEHNVGGMYEESVGDCDCDPPAAPLPPQSVRVTVCVPMTELMPNILSTFGFDVEDKTVQHSTVFRYEF